jgi:hypothetical protein
MNETATALTVVALSMGAAGLWGSSDFLGGSMARRINVFVVISVSHFISLFFIIPLSLTEPFPPFIALFYGLVQGAASFIGATTLYIGFQRGKMGLVAPFAGVVAALVPVIVTFIRAGFPTPAQLLGFGFGLLAIYLLGSGSRTDDEFEIRDLIYPIIAGLGFGMLFITTGLYSPYAIYWPLAAARFSSLVLALIIAFRIRVFKLPEIRISAALALAAALGIVGNVTFALATRLSRLDIPSVLGSLFPAVTAFWAFVVHKEKLSGKQLVGVVMAMICVMLIAL